VGAIAARIASAGSAVALVARDHEAAGAAVTDFALMLRAHARPAEAALIVAGRVDVAAAVGAHGVHLRHVDLRPADARRVMPLGWVGRSVHTVYEAGQAVDEGADYLVAGPVYETPSHPHLPPAGLTLIEEVAQFGCPVIAIGGITPERAPEVRDSGAWGAAAISALWHATNPARAALAILAPWINGGAAPDPE